MIDTPSLGDTDLKSLMDILEHSDLVFDEMSSQVEICRSYDFEKRVKLDWMDSLVQGLIKLEDLPGVLVKEQPRSWARDIVEVAWTFFTRSSAKRSYSCSSDDSRSTRDGEDSNTVFKRPRRVSPSSTAGTRSSSTDSRSSNSSRTDMNDNSESQSHDAEETRRSNNNREEDMAKYLDQTLQGVGIPKSKVLKSQRLPEFILLFFSLKGQKVN